MKDLCIMVDEYLLNIRVGVILKYKDQVLIEIPKDFPSNSVIPGGRIKIGESSLNAIIREIQEEMGVTLEKDKLKYFKIMENFFSYDNQKVHELFFIYNYDVDYDFYIKLNNVKVNLDNQMSKYLFISYNEFEKYNLLPSALRDIIKESNL